MSPEIKALIILICIDLMFIVICVIYFFAVGCDKNKPECDQDNFCVFISRLAHAFNPPGNNKCADLWDSNR